MITASKRQWQRSPDSVPQTQTHVNNEVKLSNNFIVCSEVRAFAIPLRKGIGNL